MALPPTKIYAYISTPERTFARLEEDGLLREGVDEADFIRAMAGAAWTDALNYHLCVDTGIVGFPLAEAWVAQLAKEAEQCLT